ncbi:MAG: prolyl aminopeptidase [Oligoflexia bacterium]|nr:prolyl aminopeptidase [Oligoflexia bacterium]
MRVSFFPEIDPYKTHRLKVSRIHELYVEEVGNPKGQPILFLHGGPGAGLSTKHRRFFDPRFYRIILFDQRGSGKSKPHASLEENTTWDLVSDIEKLREFLGIQKWIVFGGSWGSTLALAYSETHPDKVDGLILRGIFLCRKEEINWFYQKGCEWIFPDQWEKYFNFIPENERDDLVKAYYKRLTSSDSKLRLEAARRWSTWEGSTLKLIQDPETVSTFDEEQMALSIARIECHYFINRCWFKTDNQLIENINKIRHIPAVIVHGRYDVVCPVKNAWDLHKAWPEAKLQIISDAGHAADEPGILDALVRATESFKKLK